jgi:hypothetical protein
MLWIVTKEHTWETLCVPNIPSCPDTLQLKPQRLRLCPCSILRPWSPRTKKRNRPGRRIRSWCPPPGVVCSSIIERDGEVVSDEQITEPHCP